MRKTFGLAVLAAALAGAQTWQLQHSNTNESLRGLHAVSARVAWATGTNGTFLVTSDGGEHWLAGKVEGAEKLDFRDVHALDSRRAWVMSIGPGDLSRVYFTWDGGAHWRLQLRNPDPKGFFDQFAFWDEQNGVLVGDPVDGRLAVFTTSNGGWRWSRQRYLPLSLPGEATFAASGTGIVVRGKREAWIGTGGKNAVRVYRTSDRGRSWKVSPAPLRDDEPSAGIFSLAFAQKGLGLAVGGNYQRPEDPAANIAVTRDGGATWSNRGVASPRGYRSAVVWVPRRKAWVATGTSGSSISHDDGRTWKEFDPGAFNSVSFAPDGTGFACGPQGRIAIFVP